MQLWLVAAFASALFAGIVSILAKCGIKTIDSDVATALRTYVVVVFTWVMVAIAGSAGTIGGISPKSWLFLALSGLATGGSWICYFKALSIGDVNKVVPIDKSSTLMAVVLSIVLFNETSDLILRLAGTAVATAGTFLMIERKASDASSDSERDHRISIAYALATAIRTMFVLAMAWAIVAGKGKIGLVRGANRHALAFLAASGLATGASWLCYYYAIQMGQVSVVVQVDKLSLLVSIAFAAVVFGERLSRRGSIGLALIVAGTALVAACG